MNLQGGIYVKRLQSSEKVVGAKQTKRAIQNGKAKVVFIAQDAETRLKESVSLLSAEHSIEVIWVDSMIQLGKACSVEVKTAAAALV